MKKTILLTTICITSSIGSFAQNVNIPDASFKAYLLGNSVINSNSDTEIQVSEAAAYTGGMDLYQTGVSNLTGIEAFTNLTSFAYEENYLTTIDLSQNTALTSISCYYSYSLTSITLGQNTALTTLDLSYSPYLVSLDLSGQVNLQLLAVEISPSLSNLNISQNTALKQLYARDCNLSSLDVSNNTLLQTLNCSGNNLSALDVTKNTALTTFYCFDNNIGVLDMSNNTSLTTFQCHDNNLTILNMKNIPVTNGNQLVATDNANLTCIDVDDVTAATATWTNIDAGTSFSTNCQVDPVTAITVQGQGGALTITTQGGTLQMEANVLPSYADDDTYTWSVGNGTGSASISTSGLLTAISNGTVTVTATANDGSGVTGDVVITISNQSSVGLNEVIETKYISIFPNPTIYQLTVQTEDKINSAKITDGTGRTIPVNLNNNTIDVSSLSSGVYLLQIETDKGFVTKKFIKE